MDAVLSSKDGFVDTVLVSGRTIDFNLSIRIGVVKIHTMDNNQNTGIEWMICFSKSSFISIERLQEDHKVLAAECQPIHEQEAVQQASLHCKSLED